MSSTKTRINKTCSKCKKDLARDDFSPAGGGQYLRPECKACARKLAKERKLLRLKHGLPPEDYKCPICNKLEDQLRGIGGNAGVWVLDHCHDSQVFRGFLCHNCNLALGKLNDDIETLQKAINYLSKDNV